MNQYRTEQQEPEFVRITERIACITPTTEPLSANVAVIEGKETIWLYDVGNHGNIPAIITDLKVHTGKNIAVILSHFHPDHIGNLDKIAYEKLYVGKNTYRYTHCGEIVDRELLIEDGNIRLRIFPMPSAHAKGSLALEVNEHICFMGDALYPAYKNGQSFYNVGILQEQIGLLQNLPAQDLMLSHKKILLQKKQGVIAWMKSIYAKRIEKDPWIEVK